MVDNWILMAVGSFASAAFLTAIVTIVKLASQHGGTLNRLDTLIAAVNGLADRVDKLSANHGEKIARNDLALARLDERQSDIERRMAYLEAIVRGRGLAQDDLEKQPGSRQYRE
jgi:hypothetical protein